MHLAKPAPDPPGETPGGPTSAAATGLATAHESAALHVTGLAPYIDDLAVPRGCLHAAPILSPHAHARLLGVYISAALAMPGVHGVVLAEHLPADNVLATPAMDEPIFARAHLLHVGQVVGVVLADSHLQARRAAAAVRIEAEPLPAILTIAQALAAKSYVLPPVFVERGSPEAAIAAAPHCLQGQFHLGGQEHFYLEGQAALALPDEQGQMRVHSSTQHPGEVQHWVAHALGLQNHEVRVECRRMGGGFGGKETQAGQVAVWAAVAARHTGRAVKMRLDRDDDFLITGKRHPFFYDYTVGFDDAGRIRGLKLLIASNCGFSADLSGPVADRAIFHLDNAYFLENLSVASYRCKTNLQSMTAFRGFGGPQGMVLIETLMGEIARHLHQDPLEIRRRNFYDPSGPRAVTHYGMVVEDNVAPALTEDLAVRANYSERRAALNTASGLRPMIQKGIALTPVKFGISFTATHMNQAGALVHVYTDGSVLVNHGGTEMGQGLFTKVAQVVADELGVPLQKVRVSASDTSKVPNASPTAASSGTDLNAKAAQLAARQIKERIEPLRQPGDRFEDLVQRAYMARVQLWSDGFYATPKIHYDRTKLQGRPFYYFAYGAACAEVAIDTLTGEMRVLRVDILHDVGQSINPAIDRGQIEGGFIQGMGWLTTEELVWDASGRLKTQAPSTYKIPAAGDLPGHFAVDFWPHPNREDTVFRSKAVGEPPLMLALSVMEAVRDAIGRARLARGQSGSFCLDLPCTPERILTALRS
ncbi:MAG: xanthine dehydrogenase molybdopterin binding subunit [Burkholderiaceae bacterium]